MKTITKLLEINFDGNRIFGLDILRAVSILLVVFSHGNNYLPAEGNPIFYFLFDGVIFFFVLSGYLIGGILINILERENASFKTLINFYINRWLRTLPNYFLVLIVLAALNYFFVGDFRIEGIYKYFLFFQNLATPHPAFFPESWSLPVEEWFYLSIPAILIGTIKIFRVSVKNTVFLTSLFILLATVLFRYYRYLTIPMADTREWDLIFRRQVVTRLDGLMLGVLGAYVAYYYQAAWNRYRKTLFVLGLIVLAIVQVINALELYGLGLYLCVFYFFVSSVGTLFLLPFLSEIRSGSGLIYKAITYISITSYSMYLINYTVVQVWILNPLRFFWGEPPTVVLYLFFWFLTIVGSILIYKYYEKPFMDLRKRKKDLGVR